MRDRNKEVAILRVMYSGLDHNRRFSILINNQLIAHVRLDGSKGSEFYTVDYKISENILHNTDGIFTVKFEAAEGFVAGGIYELRLMKK